MRVAGMLVWIPFSLLPVAFAVLAVVIAVWIRRLRGELSSHGNRLAQLETTLNEGLAQQRNEIESLIDDSLEQKNAETREAQQNEIGQLSERIDAIQKNGIDRIDTYLAQLTEKLGALQDALASKLDSDQLDGRLRSLEQEIAKLNDVVSALSSSLDEGQRRVDESAAELRREVKSQIEELIGDGEKLQRQIKEAIGDDLRTAFQALDKTISSVLGEMKSDLLRGVNRIDEIENIRQAQDEGSEKTGERGAEATEQQDAPDLRE